MLRDEVPLEPEFVDGLLRADQLISLLIFLVIRILYEEFSLGKARIGVLANIASPDDGNALKCSTRTGQSLFDQCYLQINLSMIYLPDRFGTVCAVHAVSSMKQSYLVGVGNLPIVHPSKDSYLRLIIVLTNGQFGNTAGLASR